MKMHYSRKGGRKRYVSFRSETEDERADKRKTDPENGRDKTEIRSCRI